MVEDKIKAKEFCDDLLKVLRNFRNELDRVADSANSISVNGYITQFADESTYHHIGNMHSPFNLPDGGIRTTIETVRITCAEELKNSY